MSMMTLLLGILPLLAFVILDSISGVRAGVMGAIFFAILEAGYSLITLHTIDALTACSFILVVVLGLLAYKTKSALLFKMQPVILGTVFSLFFFAFQIFDEPLLVYAVHKYKAMIPQENEAALLNPYMLETFLPRVSMYLGVGFLIHAAIVAFAAVALSKWWWLILRGVGVYIMMVICILAAQVVS